MNLLKHRFISQKPDGSDATQVQPSSWNDGHAFTGGAAGDFLTRDPTDAAYGASWKTLGVWTPYTPPFTASGGGANIGDGSLAGLYTTIGKICHFNIRVRIGTTTAQGTGVWYFGLPLPAALRGIVAIVGSGTVEDTGTGIFLVSAHLADQNTFYLFTTVFPFQAGPGNPHAWAANDYISVWGTYEIQ